MADVRSLLRNERAARRITHPLATYSTTGTLICQVCQIQLKSESLWTGHLRTPSHVTRLQKYEEEQAARVSVSEGPYVDTREPDIGDEQPRKKRKISPTSDEDEGSNKRSKSGEHMMGLQEPTDQVMLPPFSTKLPSRPSSVSPPHPVPAEANTATVDEDEWAAFEKDIAAATLPISEEAIISAPAVSAAELAKQTAEETYTERKARLEAEQEAEKEDATRKLEDEFDEMKEFEERVKRLKERRDALRASAANAPQAMELSNGGGTDGDKNGIENAEEDDESSADEDEWEWS